MSTGSLTLSDLRRIDVFDDLDDSELERWLGIVKPFSVAAGEILAEQGEPARGVWFLFEGEVEATLSNDGRSEAVGHQVAPTWMGAIAVLTEGTTGVRMTAATDCEMALVEPDDFVGLVLEQRPVHRRIMAQIAPVMSRLTAMEQSRERLTSLGTMAAGLAHELNNPAAAARRAAADLVDSLEVVSGTLGRFVEAGVTREDAEILVAYQREALTRAEGRGALDALDAADAEEAMLERLEDLGVAEAWRLAEPLAHAGLEAEWLERVQAHSGAAFAPAVEWVAASLTARALACELKESADRMSRLVGAVKSYAYMDRGGVVSTDVHEGLETTLVMLGHKLKHTAIVVERHYDRSLPPLTVHGSELNQVWTNLLDNAIDALGAGGTLTITTRADGPSLVVDVANDGPPIPPEVRDRILEPFFTTKAVGLGTGLGLDTARRIVEQRHTGSLTFESGGDGTVFHVSLPIEGTAR